MSRSSPAKSEAIRFTETESGELTEYRPVNRWSVIALVTGLLSALALAHPALLLLPLLGVIVSLWAARQLAVEGAAQTGRWAMKAGMFLSVMFGTFAGTLQTYRESHLDRLARTHAENWLAMVREGNVREAHQLMLDDHQRVAPGVSLEEYYVPLPPRAADAMPAAQSGQRNGQESAGPRGVIHESAGHDHAHAHRGPEHSQESNPYLDYDLSNPSLLEEAPPSVQLYAFERGPVVARLLELGSGARVRYRRTSQRFRPNLTVLIIDQEYAVQYEQDGQSREFVIILSLQRSLFDHVASWKIVSVEIAGST